MSDILDKLAKEVDKIDENDISAVSPKSDKKNDEPEAPLSLMDELVNHQSISFPQIGDTVEGEVIDVSSNEIFLDLEPFGTGIVLGKEIRDGMGSGKVKTGDKVTATVIDLENDDGYIELSIREASYEKAWDDIESKRDTRQKVKTRILGANKGGLLVEVNGISGFLPVSQLSSQHYPRVENGDKNKILTLLKKMVSQDFEVRIIDADRDSEKLIVSEKAAQSEKEREIISSLVVGDEVVGEVSGVVDFGAFIKFSPVHKNLKEKAGDFDSIPNEQKIEGLVHISELAWQLIEDPRSIVKVGDEVRAKVIGIDSEKISLSIRALQKDPWEKAAEKYTVDSIVIGTVHKINPFGAFVYLDRDIHGLAHISEMSDAYPGKNLDELIKVGEKYDWKILSIEPKDHRMGLVLVEKKKSGKSEKEVKEKKTVKNEPATDKKSEQDKKETKEEKKVKGVKEKKTVKKETPKKKTKKETKK